MFEFFSAIVGALAVAGPVMENLGKMAQGGHRILDFAEAVLARFRRNVPPDRQQVVIRKALEQAAAMPPAEFDKAAREIVDRASPTVRPRRSRPRPSTSSSSRPGSGPHSSGARTRPARPCRWTSPSTRLATSPP